MLLQLAVGDSKDEILQQLSLISAETIPASGREEATDAEIILALQTDLAKSEYTFLDDENEDELRTIIESGSFGQGRRYVTATTNGPYRLSNAAE